MKSNTTTTTQAPTAIVARDKMTALQACEQMDALGGMGELYARSGFFGAVSASAATTAIVNAFLEGLSPLEYRAKYHTMDNGTTTVKSDFIQREFRRLGGRWTFNEWTSEVCDITYIFEGKETRGRVTLDDFKANGVAMGKNGLKENWRKFPREMLKARCMATYIRAICPEALGGLYTQEEALDFAAPIRTTATVSDSPIAPAQIDPRVSPVSGKTYGRHWDEFDTAKLKKMLDAITSTPEKYPEITTPHREAIAAVIAEREAAEAQTIDEAMRASEVADI